MPRVPVTRVARERRDPGEAGEALVVERELPGADLGVRLEAVELDERDRREHVGEIRLEPRRDLVVARPVTAARQPHRANRAPRRRRGRSRRARPRPPRGSSWRRARSRSRPTSAPSFRPRYVLSVACAASSTTGSPSAWSGARSHGWPARCTGRIARVRSVIAAGTSSGSRLRSVVTDVDEDRGRTAVLDHVRGRRPGDRARDHLVARADVERKQRKVHRGRARGDGEHMLGLEVLGHAALELGCPRAGREPARAHRLGNRRDLLLADRRWLKAETRRAGRAHR